MKLLALSDIHSNLIAVRKMRAQERNVFDAIVIAGDLGGNAVEGLFGILKTFKCPIMYVYGNWDESLGYDLSFGTSARHLHMNAVEHEGFVFVGYSGCPANWGFNPIVSELLGGEPIRMKPITADLEAAFLEYRRKRTKIDRKHERALARLNASTVSRRDTLYRQQLKTLIGKQKSEIAEAKKPMARISSSAEFNRHQTDTQKASGLKRDVLRLNRERLLETIQQSGAANHQLVIVTHERTPWRYLGHASLHMFGHRHGFSDHIYKGTRFLNVSDLDDPITARPRNKRRWSYEDCRNINGGNYVIVEMGRSGIEAVKSVAVQREYEKWAPLKNRFVEGLECIPEEKIYV
jgi:hypothetical protein